VHVTDIVDAEMSVSHLVVEHNGSDVFVRWKLHVGAANVTSVVLVWCISPSSRHACQVLVCSWLFCLAALVNFL